MPDNDYAAAVEAAEKLKKLDDDTLIEELGLRVEAEKQPGGKELVSNFDGDFDDFSDFSPEAGPGFFRYVGRATLIRLEDDLMKFICSKDDADRNKLLSGKSIPELAATLALTGLVALVAAPPAWAIVVTTIVARRITLATVDSLCGEYAKRKSARTQSSPAPPTNP